MIKGTTVAIRIGTALRALALEQKCPKDLVDDLRSGDNIEEREVCQAICVEVVEVFAVMMTTRGYDMALAEIRANGAE